MVAYVFTGMVHIFTTNLKMPVYRKEKYIFVEREICSKYKEMDKRKKH